MKKLAVMGFLAGFLALTSCSSTGGFSGPGRPEGVFNIMEADSSGYDYKVYVTNRNVQGGLDMEVAEVRTSVVTDYLAEVCGPIEVVSETYLPMTKKYGQYIMRIKCLGKGGDDYQSKRMGRKP